MPEMNLHDINSRFVNTLVMFNNKPMYFLRMDDNGKDAKLLDLVTQKNEVVPFKLEDFMVPIRRTGMVNVDGGAVYCHRNPFRRYEWGLSDGNFVVNALKGSEYPESSADRARNKVKARKCAELARSILGDYPEIGKALRQVRQFYGAVAFDKQFAVTSEGQVYYKTKAVGKVDLKAKSVDDIKFSKGNEHLILLLNNNYAADNFANFELA